MALRNYALLLIIIILMLVQGGAVSADEGKTVAFGVNSTAGGYVMQVNNRGGMNYARFIGVAPIVNKIRIVNLSNGSIIFDGCPTVGTTIYMPQGSYMVTGWSAYGTEDTNGIVAIFTQAPSQSPAQAQQPQSPQTQAQQSQSPQTQTQQSQSPQTQAPQAQSPQIQAQQLQAPQTQAPQAQAAPSVVNGNFVPTSTVQDTTTILNGANSGGYIYPYPVYSYPGGVPYVYPAPPVTQPRFIWCNYCGRYHAPCGCVFTTPQHNILEQSNPYWRPPVTTPSPCSK